MSDAPQGPGWWQASDDKWYPPPRPEMPGEAPDQQPPQAPPTGPPTGPPSGPPHDPYGSGQMPMQGAPGSYGSYPGAPGQQPSHSNRTAIFVGGGVVGTLLILLLLFVLLGDDDSDDDPQQTLTTETTDDPPTTEAPVTTEDTLPPDTTGGGGGGGGAGLDGEYPSNYYSAETVELGNDLAIVEYGFSNVPDYYDDTEIDASYGVIIENTGSNVQENVQLIVTANAEDGSTLGSENFDIAFIDAGETMAIGYVFSDGLFDTIDDLDFSFGSSSSGGSLGDGGIEITSVTTTAAGSSTDVTFGLDNNYAYELSYPYTTAIIRNTDGEIIGGNTSIIALPSNVPADASTGGDLTFWADFQPVDLDVDATDIWVYFTP